MHGRGQDGPEESGRKVKSLSAVQCLRCRGEAPNGDVQLAAVHTALMLEDSPPMTTTYTAYLQTWSRRESVEWRVHQHSHYWTMSLKVPVLPGGLKLHFCILKFVYYCNIYNIYIYIYYIYYTIYIYYNSILYISAQQAEMNESIMGLFGHLF